MKVSDKKDVSVPAEQPAVRTTIVGGRPPGPGKGVGAVPRGIEVLVKKAAVDPEFKTLLLAKRSAAAAEIGLELSDTEAAILNGVPVEQLKSIIANTTVGPKIRPAFMGRAAAVMLTALTTVTSVFADVGLVSDPTETGIAQRGKPDKNPTSEKASDKDSGNGEEVGTGIISGRVTNWNGAPSVNAAVRIEELFVVEYTDEEGYFIFNNVPVGYYTVKFLYPEHSFITYEAVKVVPDMKTIINCDIRSITEARRPDIPELKRGKAVYDQAADASNSTTENEDE